MSSAAPAVSAPAESTPELTPDLPAVGLTGLASLDQLELFSPDVGKRRRQKATGPVRRRRPRIYDYAILRYVAYHRTVSTAQVTYRFFNYRGKRASSGVRIIRQMVERGWLTSTPYDPAKGRASRHVLSLTAAGWAELGYADPPKDAWHVSPDVIRDYHLQFAEVMLVREVEAWTLVRPDEAPATLRTWGLNQYRGRSLNDSDRVYRDRLEKLPPFQMPCPLLAKRDGSGVRILFSAIRGRSVQNVLDQMPVSVLGLLPPLEFEVVCADPQLTEKVEQQIRRWSETTKIRCAIILPPFFWQRVHPLKADTIAEDLYAKNGAPDPRRLATRR